tara:strand:- start:191 stop:325 length:135 start_codon:yes stop_codon:yes gene_type:complete
LSGQPLLATDEVEVQMMKDTLTVNLNDASKIQKAILRVVQDVLQ